MKSTNSIGILITIIASLFLIPSVSADSTINVTVSGNTSNTQSDVTVKNNTGANTICINGKCTTSSDSSTAHTHVCVNGNCYDTTDSNVHVHSSDQVQNDTSPKVLLSPSLSPTLSASPSPTQEIRKKVVEEKQASLIENFIASCTAFFKHFHLF